MTSCKQEISEAALAHEGDNQDPSVDKGEGSREGPKQRRVWRRVTEMERMRLEAAVKFGLPVAFAGQVVNTNLRNANRVMFTHMSLKQAEKAKMSTLSVEQQREAKEAYKATYQEGALQAVMAISEAREKGFIKKRNILKMDAKVNEQVSKYVKKHAP